MNEIVSNLLVYGSLPEDSILWQLADICEKLKDGTETKAALRGRVFHQVKNLLTVATDYAFDKNLWHNYLTFLLITNENPFSLVCEKMGAQEGTVNNLSLIHISTVALLTDGRFSGASCGAAIGHISPEAAAGGPIAYIKDGDKIAIDIPNYSLKLLVSDEEMEERKKTMKIREPKKLTGYLKRYAKNVSSADKGAIVE